MWLSLTSFTAFSVSSIWLSFPCNSQRSLATHWIVWLGRFYIQSFPCVYHSTTRAIFQWTNLCCLGGTRTLQPSPDLHSQRSTSWTTRLPFVWRLLQALLTQPLWTTMDCHCGFQNSRHKSLYFIKSLQDLLHPEYILDNDDSFRVVSCLYKLFGSWLQIGHIQIRTGTTTPLSNLFL